MAPVTGQRRHDGLAGWSGSPNATCGARLAAAGILLASGVLGAITQFAAASEGRAIIESLRSLPSSSTLSRRIVAMGRGVEIVRFVTPAIFVLTSLAIVLNALYRSPGQFGLGLLVIASGIPLYLWLTRRRRPT